MNRSCQKRNVIFLFVLSIFFVLPAFSQAPFWTETFEAGITTFGSDYRVRFVPGRTGQGASYVDPFGVEFWPYGECYSIWWILDWFIPYSFYNNGAIECDLFLRSAHYPRVPDYPVYIFSLPA